MWTEEANKCFHSLTQSEEKVQIDVSPRFQRQCTSRFGWFPSFQIYSVVNGIASVYVKTIDGKNINEILKIEGLAEYCEEGYMSKVYPVWVWVAMEC